MNTQRKDPPFVLLVESDEHLSARMELLLQQAGFAAFRVANCRAARDTLNAVVFPMVIIDRDLDDGEALELIADIRDTNCEHGVFILMLTAMDCDDAVAVWLAAGADDCVNRRSTDEQIKLTLHKALSFLGLRPVSTTH